ncbi:MAG: type II toxin-antitoxin system MqsA family antitoxin [Lysobacteraceae bacterium]
MKLPSVCHECGGRNLYAFTGETFHIGPPGGRRAVADLAGWRCADCGEADLEPASLARYAAAGDALVLARREAEQKTLRAMRKRLKLTQHEAAQLTGGGPNAFSRYERGEARPMPAVINLFKLLDKHPELLKELQG